MQANRAKKAEGEKIHPEILSVTDALSFRVARFSLLNERLGGRSMSGASSA